MKVGDTDGIAGSLALPPSGAAHTSTIKKAPNCADSVLAMLLTNFETLACIDVPPGAIRYEASPWTSCSVAASS